MFVGVLNMPKLLAIYQKVVYFSSCRETLVCVFFFSCRDSCSFFVVCVVIYGKFGFGCSKETKSTRQNGCGPNIINNYKEESVNQLARYTHHTHTHTPSVTHQPTPPHPLTRQPPPSSPIPNYNTLLYLSIFLSLSLQLHINQKRKERKEKGM